VTLIGGTFLASAQLFALLTTHRSPAPWTMQTLMMFLMACSAYSWTVLPLGAAITVSAMAGVTMIACWIGARAMLGALDVFVLIGLIVIASLTQHQWTRRLRQLGQKVKDLDEEVYLNEQTLQAEQRGRESLQRKLAKYQQLHAIAEQLSRLSELEAIGELIVERTRELIGKSDACLLFLLDASHHHLALFASERGPDVPAIRAKHGDQFDHYVLRTQRPLLVNDVRRDFRFSVASGTDRPIGSVIACPVVVGEKAEGVLRLDSPSPSAYTQDDLRFLDILLGLVDTAIANARLFAQTQQLAMTDGLTELYRRQPLLEQLARELARATRSREPLAVLMLDIDDFKSYNDVFGHTAGDMVLKAVAQILRSIVPPDGMSARYGGEEFAMLLPKASRSQGVGIAQRIRATIEQQLQPSARGLGRAVTVSVGVAVFPDDAQSDVELLRRADDRLYDAKRAGKNRVCAT